jgi:carbon storage regulator
MEEESEAGASLSANGLTNYWPAIAKEVETMLVLTRKAGERIVIDDSIVVEVLEIQGNRVRIGIQAPAGVTILREELLAGKGNTPAGQTPGHLAKVP